MLKCPNDDLNTFYQGHIPFLSFDVLNYLMGDHVPSADALSSGAQSIPTKLDHIRGTF